MGRAANVKLSDWIKETMQRGLFPSASAVIRFLVIRTDIAGEHVSRTTIGMVARGGVLRNVQKANAISRATDGAVSPTEMLEQP